MLSETKLALRIKTNIYDGEIARLIEAAVGDLGIVDVDAAGVSSLFPPPPPARPSRTTAPSPTNS